MDVLFGTEIETNLWTMKEEKLIAISEDERILLQEVKSILPMLKD